MDVKPFSLSAVGSTSLFRAPQGKSRHDELCFSPVNIGTKTFN